MKSLLTRFLFNSLLRNCLTAVSYTHLGIVIEQARRFKNLGEEFHINSTDNIPNKINKFGHICTITSRHFEHVIRRDTGITKYITIAVSTLPCGSELCHGFLLRDKTIIYKQ